MKKNSQQEGSSQQERLEAVVRRTVERYALFAPGATVLVGVSGGPDSTALLYLLAGFRNEWGLTLVAAHLNHGFRGAEADADAEYVADLCRALAVPCVSERIDVPALQRRRRLSAQEAAREARHAFLRRSAVDRRADRIALGHNRDDRIETILLNLLRGAGLEGLSGFPPLDSSPADSATVPVNQPSVDPPSVDPPSNRLHLIRPLYDASRAQIEAYCAANDLTPRRDSSNEHTDYSRNRVRAELLPYLVSYYNERVGDALLRTAELASADNELLETMATESLATITSDSSNASLTITTEGLLALPLALRRRVLRLAIAARRGSLRDIEFSLIDHTLELLASGRKTDCQLPYGDEAAIRMQGDSRTLTISRVPAARTVLPWLIELAVPGTTLVPQANCAVEIRITKRSDGETEAADLAGFDCVLGSEPTESPVIVTAGDDPEKGNRKEDNRESGQWHGFLLDELTMPLTVRSRRPGDSMHLRGGSKKIQDLLVDAKLPSSQRDLFPLIVDANGAGRILAAGWLRAASNALSQVGLSLPQADRQAQIHARRVFDQQNEEQAEEFKKRKAEMNVESCDTHIVSYEILWMRVACTKVDSFEA